DVRFDWVKRKTEGCIFKDILVCDGDKRFSFQERVQLFESEMLQQMLQSSGLNPVACYGDYQLNRFDPTSSPRCIIFATRS
ncbi:MAG: hypothetical protein ACKOZY_04690, partial [Flavobacteriales bacterium]